MFQLDIDFLSLNIYSKGLGVSENDLAAYKKYMCTQIGCRTARLTLANDANIRRTAKSNPIKLSTYKCGI
jgi:hypothetical protein